MQLKIFFTAIVSVFLAAPVLCGAALYGSTDKNAVSYAPGEEMVFTLTPAGVEGDLSNMQVTWERNGDDGIQCSGVADIVDGKAVITTSIDKPGFVHIVASLVDREGNPPEGNPVLFEGGAAVQPEKLLPAPEPEDFDDFWADQREKLADVPVEAEVRKVGEGVNCNIYAVRVLCAGPCPVTGYMYIPKNAKPGSLPARAVFHGYGIDIQKPGTDGTEDEICFSVNPHGYELDGDEEYYRNFINSLFVNGVGYAFDTKTNSDPETAYFNGMALRVMRAMEFLKTLPEWNGRDLYATGNSQGGMQAIWAAALDKDVTFLRADVPWCCDMAAESMERYRPGGIPYVPGLDYYDPVHHARRISCRTEVQRAGMGDYVCPPAGVAVFYNNLSCPKSIWFVQGSTHNYIPPHAERVLR